MGIMMNGGLLGLVVILSDYSMFPIVFPIFPWVFHRFPIFLWVFHGFSIMKTASTSLRALAMAATAPLASAAQMAE